MNITQKYLPVPSERRPGLKILPIKYIVCHDTGNLNSTAMNNVDYYIKTANLEKASAHVFIDDAQIIECIPLSEKAYHVRRVVSNAIDEALAIELCYFTDLERSKLAYNNYVEYIRGLCQKYNLDPLKQVIGHYILDPTRRKDPVNSFSRIGKTWDDFIKDVTGTPPFSKTKNDIKKEIAQILQKVGELIQKL